MGYPFQGWINEIPNQGLIYYRFILNAERIFVTSPKGLAEVLVHKNYDFIKPKELVEGVGRILGIGLLVAEGGEHKVACHGNMKRSDDEYSFAKKPKIDSEKEFDASVSSSSCERLVRYLLVQVPRNGRRNHHNRQRERSSSEYR